MVPIVYNVLLHVILVKGMLWQFCLACLGILSICNMLPLRNYLLTVSVLFISGLYSHRWGGCNTSALSY